MKNIKKIREKITDFMIKINRIELLFIFILLNPILDLMTSLGINEKISFIGSFGFLFRGVFLLVMMLNIVFHKNKNRKKYIILLGIIAIFYGVFNVNRFFIDPSFQFILELKAFIKSFYLPILFIGMLNYFDYSKKLGEDTYCKLFRTISITTIIYILLIAIPAMLGFGYKTYSAGKQGAIGFFNSPNEIGTILAILSPVVLNYVSNMNNKILGPFISILFISIALIIGTKTPLLGICIAIVANVFFIILSFIKNRDKRVFKKMFYPGYWAIIVFVALITFSPLLSNIGWQSNLFDTKNPIVIKENNSLISTPSSGELENNNENNGVNNSGANNKNAEDNGITDSNGNVNSKNEDTTEGVKENRIIKKIKNLIFSSRDIYINKGLTTFENSHMTEKLFGLGNMSLKADYKNTVEVDLFDILFNYGIVGFILYFGILLCGIYHVIKNFIYDFKHGVRNSIFQSAMTGVIIGVLVACTAGHTMLAPAVSGYLAILLAICCSVFCCESKKHNLIISFEKIFTFFKKNNVWIIIFFVLICFIVVWCSIRVNFNNMISVSDDGIHFLGEQISKSYELADLEEIEEFGIRNKTYVYKHVRENVSLIFTRRTFENGSVGNLITIHNNSTKLVGFKLEIPNDMNDYVFDFSNQEIVKEYSTTVGYDKTTLPSLYLEENDDSFLIGKSFHYKNVLLSYDAENYSTYKDLFSETNDLKKQFFKTYKEIDVPSNSSVDTYYYEANKKLFNSETSINNYIGLLNSSRSSSWIASDGTYHKLPYSIEPSSKEAYGRNVGGMVEKDVYNLLLKDDSIILEDIVLQSLLVYFNYMPRGDSGVWLTEYTSTWLKKDYGTEALYVDTRHNENLSLYFELVNERLNNEELENAVFTYADFLMDKYNKKELISLKQGNLYPDYFTNNATGGGEHASLNHQLAIANYLFASYEKSNNKDYYNVAKGIIKTIEKIGNNWIKDNKDLWYEIKTDGAFSGKDYEELTLGDLLTTQEYLLKHDKKKSKALDKLIKSKIEYLDTINYTISSYTVTKMKDGGYVD